MLLSSVYGMERTNHPVSTQYAQPELIFYSPGSWDSQRLIITEYRRGSLEIQRLWHMNMAQFSGERADREWAHNVMWKLPHTGTEMTHQTPQPENKWRQSPPEDTYLASGRLIKIESLISPQVLLNDVFVIDVQYHSRSRLRPDANQVHWNPT